MNDEQPLEQKGATSIAKMVCDLPITTIESSLSAAATSATNTGAVSGDLPIVSVRRCEACQSFLGKSKFSKKQWQKEPSEEIICLKCGKEKRESQNHTRASSKKRKRDAFAQEASVKNDNATEKLCGGCNESKIYFKFSTNQWQLSVDYERLCKSCCEIEVQAKREHRSMQKQLLRASPNLKRCYGCHNSLTEDTYSKQQKKKTVWYVPFLRGSCSKRPKSRN